MTLHPSETNDPRPRAAVPDNARRRFTTGAMVLGGAAVLPLLGGCAGPELADYTGQTPVLDFRKFFDGRIVAHGMVMDRSGKVTRRMIVTMDCRWNGDQGVLDESFLYDDGERQQRQWRVEQGPGGRFTGTADDVVGTASGAASGAAFNWRYTLKVPVKDRVWELDFDDWMFLVDDRTLLNKAVMSKFGVRVGELLLSFTKA